MIRLLLPGVFASENLLIGTFIGCISGELISSGEAERRSLYYCPIFPSQLRSLTTFIYPSTQDESGRMSIIDIDCWHLPRADLKEKMFAIDTNHVGNVCMDHTQVE